MMDKQTEEKIKEMQLVEQNLQNILIQKQNFQVQLIDIGSALEEIEKSSEQYKIVGPIMVKAEKEDLKKDLKSKKNLFESRLKDLEKQELQFKDRAGKLQAELMKEFEQQTKSS